MYQSNEVTIGNQKDYCNCVYRFAREFNPKHLSNGFDVGTSTLHKYVNVVCNVLCNKNKFFGKISSSFEDHLLHIIQQFQELIGLQNICGIIDGTHISLVEMPK